MCEEIHKGDWNMELGRIFRRFNWKPRDKGFIEIDGFVCLSLREAKGFSGNADNGFDNWY